MENIRTKFEDAAIPVARLLGHALAAALGSCGLGLISLIPILVVKALLWLGFSGLAGPLRRLEAPLLFADIGPFALVLLSGIAVFAAETIAAARRRIRHARKDSGHDE